MALPRQVALGDVAVIEREIIDSTAIATGTLYVGLENIESGGRFIGVRPVDAGELASSKFAFTPQHLLYGKLRPYLAKIARPDFVGICSTDILPVLPGPDLDRGYLAWLLLTPQMVTLANSRATGANLPRLSPTALAELRIPLPPLPEQRKIAAILSSVDETIEKTEAVIAQLDVVKKAMLEELLTRGIPGRHSRFKQTEIGDVPTDWSVITLDACNDPSRPICYGILMPGKHCADGVPVIKVKNIKNGEVDASDLLLTAPEIDAQYRRSRLRAGDLLLTIRGTTGRVALVPDALASANITQDTARVSAGESTSSAFLYYALQSVNAQAQIRDHTRGQAVKGINIGAVRRLLLPLPPKGEQQTIVETVRAIDEGFRAESLALSALRATKNALAAVLLAGELRVTAEDAA